MTSAWSTFDFNISQTNGVLELTLRGELDLASRDTLEAVISKVEADPCVVVAQLAHLTFLDSSGLVSLVRLAKVATRFELRGATGSVAQVLALTGADEAYPPGPD